MPYMIVTESQEVAKIVQDSHKYILLKYQANPQN